MSSPRASSIHKEASIKHVEDNPAISAENYKRNVNAKLVPITMGAVEASCAHEFAGSSTL